MSDPTPTPDAGPDEGPTEAPPEPSAAERPLAVVVHEVEAHAAGAGWDQPAQLFALVETADLLEREPQLAALLGVEDGGALAPDHLTPVEQEGVDGELEELLAQIVWPPEVVGCAAVVERVVLPPEADAEIPTEPDAAAAYAAEHPDRQEVRIVAGALRSGPSWCALRLRSHDDETSVVGSNDLVPALLELLHSTLEPDAGDPTHE